MQNLSESWFLHEDHRSRVLDRSIWVPVYGVHYPIEEKNYPEIGHIQEFLHIKAALVDLTSLAASEELDIHNFLSRNQKPYVSRDGVFHEGNKLGRELINMLPGLRLF